MPDVGTMLFKVRKNLDGTVGVIKADHLTAVVLDEPLVQEHAAEASSGGNKSSFHLGYPFRVTHLCKLLPYDLF